jgi:hypothetical protein
MEESGRELERIRRNALRGMEYNFADVDALLELADLYDGPPRFAEGMVEMQRLFMKHTPHGASALGVDSEEREALGADEADQDGEAL